MAREASVVQAAAEQAARAQAHSQGAHPGGAIAGLPQIAIDDDDDVPAALRGDDDDDVPAALRGGDDDDLMPTSLRGHHAALPRSGGGAGMQDLLTNDLPDDGLMIGHEAPFADPLRGGGSGAALDLVSIPPRAGAAASQPKPEPAAAPEQERGRAVRDIANYGERPHNVLQAVPYFVKVMLRKRVLEQELVALTATRKRADGQADDAMCALGEALCARANDPRLKPLVQQFRVVTDARAQVGNKEAEGQVAGEMHQQELARITRALAKVELEVQPLRRRETEIQAHADALKLQIKKRETLVKQTDAELAKARASKEISAADRIAVLQAQREAQQGELQSFNVQLVPLHEDLGGLRREIAKHMGTISALREEESAALRAKDRELERLRVSTGSAKNAYRDALRALATTAERGGHTKLTPDEAKNAIEAEFRAQKRRELEELHRVAMNSYDEERYKQGMYLIVGSTALLFIVPLALIFR